MSKEPEVAELPAPVEVGLKKSPLTDPRALATSIAIHALLLAIASAFAFQTIAPREEPAPSRTLLGELESTDNRAPAHDAGGGGEITGGSADLSVERGSPTKPTRDPSADSLISEILPTIPSADSSMQALPGPSTSSTSLQGASMGEGGGQGGGSGGGTGSGTGPGTEFFGMRDRGGSFAYVIDRSGSMTTKNSLNVAKRELLTSLDKIPAEAQFMVVFYNLDATVFTDPTGRAGMMPATASNKVRVRNLLLTVEPDGGTEHVRALRAALAFKPEVLFFLTDADNMSRQEVAEILTISGKTRIQTVEFGSSTGLGGSDALRSLARSTGGLYRYIDVKTFDGR